MCLLEYQAMSSLHDVAQDGCVHLLYNSSWKFRQVAAGSSCQSSQSMTYKITPAGSQISSARRASVLGQPSSLQPHWE
jgi:hypothetical protein